MLGNDLGLRVFRTDGQNGAAELPVFEPRITSRLLHHMVPGQNRPNVYARIPLEESEKSWLFGPTKMVTFGIDTVSLQECI